MDRRLALAVALAAVLALVVLLTQPRQSGERLYVYELSEGAVAYYVPIDEGVFYGQLHGGASIYLVFRGGVVNLLYDGVRATFYNKLLEICVNSTTHTVIAGEPITLSNRQCIPSTSPLPTARSFDEAALLALYLLTGGDVPPAPQWRQAGAAQTPMGLATVYTAEASHPRVPGAVYQYETQVLSDGTVYALKIRLSYGGQVAAALTYTLKNITAVPNDVRDVIGELLKNVVATGGGGLDILRVAEKIGMKFDGNWPAAVVFFDLQCPYCAKLFKYNYTLFQGHRLVLVDLIVHPTITEAHQRLRCLYQQDPGGVIPTLRILYDRFLAGDPNYTDVLPERQCDVDVNAGMQLAALLAGPNAGTPMVVVVYPNGTYTLVVGYHPEDIAKALGNSVKTPTE